MSYPQDTAKGEETLLAEGFERRFVAGEPRLSESIELYGNLGFAVALRPLDEGEFASEECTECYRAAPHLYRVIYTRRR